MYDIARVPVWQHCFEITIKTNKIFIFENVFDIDTFGVRQYYKSKAKFESNFFTLPLYECCTIPLYECCTKYTGFLIHTLLQKKTKTI